jgi:luciferase family oxidoreductase group 1
VPAGGPASSQPASAEHSPPSLALSVLDQCPIRAGATAADAVREAVQLARAADHLGYRRYWLAEHHNSESLACAAPEALIGQVATATKRMRVGSGGVMLSHYSALKVAEVFRMLETLYPGRIDLGIGRAPGSDRLTARILAHGPGRLGIQHYPEQVADLLGYLGRDHQDERLNGVRAMPQGDTQPEVWLLGSSLGSARFAAWFGCPYSFAHFIQPRDAEAALDLYRSEYRPSERHPEPRASVGVSVMVAETGEEARRQSLSRFLWWIRLTQGRPGPFPSMEEAEAYEFTDRDRKVREKMQARSLIGSPDAVRERAEELAGRLGVRELVVLTICPSFEARARSYELLAEAVGLS